MGLVDTVTTDHRQTVLEMLAAADERHLEASALGDDGDWPSGGIYLLGYVAEMHLKSAYARLVFGYAAATVEWPELLEQAKRDGCWGTVLDSVPAGGAHSLVLWKQLLLDARGRTVALLPLPEQTRLRLDDVVDWLDQNWCVGMRYAAGYATPEAFQQMAEQVDWLEQAYPVLVGDR